jgi:hypothetical protein
VALRGETWGFAFFVLTGSAQPAEAVTPAHLEGRRPANFTVTELLATFAPVADGGSFFSPRDVQERLGCSESSARRLIREALEAGATARARGDTYQPVTRMS